MPDLSDELFKDFSIHFYSVLYTLLLVAALFVLCFILKGVLE